MLFFGLFEERILPSPPTEVVLSGAGGVVYRLSLSAGVLRWLPWWIGASGLRLLGCRLSSAGLPSGGKRSACGDDSSVFGISADVPDARSDKGWPQRR